ncbi:MAG TPA: ABC transporter ATP-binding protein, partial [Micromonosporaceae bacterium]
IIRLIPAGGPILVTTAIVLQVVAGVVPVLFVLATAKVIADVPPAVRTGVHSDAWVQLRDWLTIAAVLFFTIQLLLPVQAYVGDVLKRRVDGLVRDRLMVAAFVGGGVAVLEDPELLDQAAGARNSLRFAMNTPGAACAGLIALISRYLQTVLAAVVVGVAFSWLVGVAVLVSGLVIRFGYRVGLSAFGTAYRALNRRRRKSFYFRDLMLKSDAAKEIRVFGLLDWVSDGYHESFMDSAKPLWQARRRIFYGPYVLYTLIAFVALSTALAWAAGTAARGDLGIGGLMIVAQGSLSAIRIGGFIAESDVQTEYGILAHRSTQRFEELTVAAVPDLPPEPLDDPAGRPAREIRFVDVTFRYRPGAPPVLDTLNLTIRAGTSLAIVGLNGAGKTTLVKLLARLYEPESGAILVDGVDIRSFPVDLWQRQVAAIFQDFVHFELPVRDNVGFGAIEIRDDPDGGTRAVTRALQRAGALAFVESLPKGLDTPLSRQYTDGADLSGGQWQRIAIARALLAVDGGATVLVLDEPTASLDVRAEVAFFEEFLQLTEGATSLIISHRFSTVRRADQIAVLEHGRVLEQGTHDELLRLDGRYAELFRLQAARFSDDGETDDDETDDDGEGAGMPVKVEADHG